MFIADRSRGINCGDYEIIPQCKDFGVVCSYTKQLLLGGEASPYPECEEAKTDVARYKITLLIIKTALSIQNTYSTHLATSNSG